MYNIDTQSAHLNKSEMDDVWGSAVEQSVSTIFCTVPHTVVSAISCNDHFIFLGAFKQFFLALFPVHQDAREQLVL